MEDVVGYNSEEQNDALQEGNGIDVPDIPLEEYEVPSGEIESAIGVKNEYVGSIDYGIIGSGQCGGRLAKSFYSIGYKKTLAINTAQADLVPLELPESQKLKIGSFEGSGKSMRKGEQAAKEDMQRILDKMRDVFGTVDKIVICVGFGGGTGAGSAEVLIDLATKYLSDLKQKPSPIDVILLAALPTAGELKSSTVKKNVELIQERIFTLAEEAKVGPILLIDNSKIEKMYRGIPPRKFWSTINDTITGLFQMFNYLSLQKSGYTSFDTEDYKAVLGVSGLAVMGVTRVPRLDVDSVKLSQVLQDNFKKTLLARNVLYETAKEAACVVVGDSNTMEAVSMDVINYGFDALHNLVGNANLHRGLYESRKQGVRAYTLITGMRPVKEERTSIY